MKAVLISIRPKWCELIASGKKTVEVRKTKPKLETPFKCYIYMTSGDASIPDGTGMVHHHSGGQCVIGEFICDKILDICISCSDPNMTGLPFPYTGLTDREIMDYLGNGKTGYGWHINDLVIYDRPKELSEFRSYNCSVYWKDGYPMPTHEIKRPPQSWYYAKGGEAE